MSVIQRGLSKDVKPKMINLNLISFVNWKWLLKGTSVKQRSLREDLRLLLITCRKSRTVSCYQRVQIRAFEESNNQHSQIPRDKLMCPSY